MRYVGGVVSSRSRQTTLRRTRKPTLWLFVVVCSCGAEPAAIGEDAGESTPPPDEPAPEPTPCGANSGFASDGAIWTLPFEVEGVEDGGQIVRWRWVQADDDGRPDLLSLPEPMGVLEPHFELWRNTGAGFDDPAVRWDVDFFTETLDAGASGAWGLIDIDGDGWLDVVDARGSGSVGGTAWTLRRGGPAGLSPTLWSIPFPTGPQLGDGDVAQWGPIDLDGDGVLDMVALKGDASDGVSTWSWWPGAHSGFSPFERSWSIPFRLDALRDPDAQPSWRLVDLDGDGPLDLVVADPQGGPRWTVYRGKDAGFAGAPIRVDLPLAVRHVRDTRAIPTWRLLDVDGDARLDFVTTTEDPEQWSIHFGQAPQSGAFGFGTDPTPWRLGFVSDRVEDRSIAPAWTVRDLDGDGVVDLVRTTSAADRVAVHRGECVPD